MLPPPKPSPCRVHAFIDGQNLYFSVKRIFGYTFPNYDPLRLAHAVAGLTPGRQLEQVHFYTGTPKPEHSQRWHQFWRAKIRAMTDSGVRVVTRTLLYGPGSIPREKGIDLRLALDLLRLARQGKFDAALIFSQDSDLAEAVQEIHGLRREMHRWLVVDCAYPHDPNSPESTWGIAGARPVPFDKAFYDTCIDPGNYFPPPAAPRLPGMT